jgi:site-specific recombinase XerD
MRRAAVTNLDLAGVDWKGRTLSVVEKGGYTHGYSISKEGLQAIPDYVENERTPDAEHWRSPALFPTACNNARSGERLSVRSVNVI